MRTPLITTRRGITSRPITGNRTMPQCIGQPTKPKCIISPSIRLLTWLCRRIISIARDGTSIVRAVTAGVVIIPGVDITTRKPFGGHTELKIYSTLSKTLSRLS